MLKQYQEIKSRHQDAILFFRLGDFYEMFFDDAKQASAILDLVLTSRGQETTGKIPMCGVPFHAADNYIAKLVKAGKKVAICEQTEDPALAKGLVKRDVIRIVTAGTYLDDSTDSRFILSIVSNGNKLGLALNDSCSGTILANEFDTRQAIEILAKLPIYECLFPQGQEEHLNHWLNHPLLSTTRKHMALSPFGDWAFNNEMASKSLKNHFAVHSLKGFGIDHLPLAVSASGALLEYLKSVSKKPLAHLNKISLYTQSDYVFISPAAHYGLELNSVLETLDHTLTPMGRRLFRSWLHHPLKNTAAIHQRQNAANVLREKTHTHEQLNQCLKHLPDLQKSLTRLSSGCSSIKDLLAIRQALLRTPLIAEAITPLNDPLLTLSDIPSLRELLSKTINPDVPLAKPEGKIVNPGIDSSLDQWRAILDQGKQWLANYQLEEIKRTGISSLKVGFNNVFGFYIEISKANQKNAPSDYIRKQTLVNGERFITPALKEYETKYLSANDKILEIEHNILSKVEQAILQESVALQHWCEQIAVIDSLQSLGTLSHWDHYIFPIINDSTTINIKEGRHPVVERSVGATFISNDTLLDTNDNHLIILTGPNMAGKSTYIRQTAILVIMAQMGAPIPANEATIGLVDKIFTRIGAHDDIAHGQSTFMVEMTETADILNNLTERSLVILDEIGRGTSTTDGLALAWALAEHMHQTKARTLFATHFHELVDLANRFTGIKNYNVSVREWQDKIIFMHKIVPGGCDDSYGIYVAKLAGIPSTVIKRSTSILNELEKRASKPAQDTSAQLKLFEPTTDPNTQVLREALSKIDLNNTTPIQALQHLICLKEIINNGNKSR